MKIALIGYGKMGRTIEQIAVSRGHTITVAIDIDNQEMFESEAFRGSDVAIEFTVPSTAYDNYIKCFAANVPVVSGTTGWLDRIDEIKGYCAKGKTFFYTSNFSLGVNLFFAVNKYLAKIMNNYPDYDVTMEEVHHIHKLDAPSGTAITLAEDLVAAIDRKTVWSKEVAANDGEMPIHSIRRDEVPGIHEIFYESDCDIISIKHDAKSRKGFALGAVLAAEYAHDKVGFLGMDDMLGF